MLCFCIHVDAICWRCHMLEHNCYLLKIVVMLLIWALLCIEDSILHAWTHMLSTEDSMLHALTHVLSTEDSMLHAWTHMLSTEDSMLHAWTHTIY